MSIKWKLLIYLLIFIAITVAALWILETALLDNFYNFIKTREIDEAADNLQRAAQGIADGEIENFERMLLTEARSLNAQITLFDTDNAVIYYAGYGAPERPEFDRDLDDFFDDDDDDDDDFKRIARGRSLERSSRGENETIMNISEFEIGGVSYIMKIEAEVETVSAAVTTIKVILLIITAALVCAAFILSRVLYKKLATPIIETERSALKLAKGDRNVDFDAKGYLEIESLNGTLDFAQSEILKSDRLQREIIANVSHDLKTPLTLIAGYAEMLRDMPSEDTAENAQVIVDEAARLNELVNDMLDLSKLNSGTKALDISEFSLTDLITKIAEQYTALKADSDLTIVFEHLENVWCKADKGEISRVVYNLITNADIHGGKDKLILIEQKVEDGLAKISFTDHGGGIKEEDLNDIWNRYKTGVSDKRGTGLGLNIVSSILKLHGANYGVINRPSEGATFWFKIKASKVESE